MKSRRLIAMGMAAGLLVAGCAGKPKQTASNQVAPPQAAPGGQVDAEASQPMTIDPPAFNPAEAMARKTAAYSQQIESAMASPAASPVASSNAPARRSKASLLDSHESRVDWGDANDFGLGSAESTKSSRLFSHDAPVAARPALLVASPAVVNPTPPADSRQSAAPNAGAVVVPPVIASDSTSAGTSSAPAGSIESLSMKFDRRVKDYPRDVSGHLDYQLWRFLLDERVPDLSAIASLPVEDRELIATVVDGLSNFRSSLRQDNNMLLSRKIKPMLEMSDRLRSQADLMIPNIALCTSVRTFGEYDPIDPARFAAGEAHPVILYCEVENFASQLDSRQMWQTKLTKDAVLYTENGMQVWSDKSETVIDTSRRRRHDFFLVEKLTIPANLAVGRYLMKVSIVDQQVSRVAEATIPIVIAAQGGAR